MSEERLYKNLAKYYDLIYSDKDYQEEAGKFEKIISDYKETEGKKLLDVACGSGGHLQYFVENFDCVGLDLNEDMLKIARDRLDDVKLLKANMIDFELDEKFDVITCLFSSIGYVKTYENLERTTRNFVEHLKEGGVVIIQPWFNREQFNEGQVHIKTYDGEDVKVQRMSYPTLEGDLSKLNMHYLIGENKRGIEHFTDVHELGLFEPKRMLEIMEQSGLETERKKEGEDDRGIYIGVKK
jgi:ubiquinone/menaquinone biosynthesis C-methylase UbiE